MLHRERVRQPEHLLQGDNGGQGHGSLAAVIEENGLSVQYCRDSPFSSITVTLRSQPQPTVLDFGNVPPSCPVTQPILPNLHLPRQNLADSGMTKFIVNPTPVPDHHCHPVHRTVAVVGSSLPPFCSVPLLISDLPE